MPARPYTDPHAVAVGNEDPRRVPHFDRVGDGRGGGVDPLDRPPASAAQTASAPAVRATGEPPSRAVPVTVPVEGSMRVTVPSSSFVTQIAPAPAAIDSEGPPDGDRWVSPSRSRPG